MSSAALPLTFARMCAAKEGGPAIVDDHPGVSSDEAA